MGSFYLALHQIFLKGEVQNQMSFDEVWCLQHNETNEIIANE